MIHQNQYNYLIGGLIIWKDYEIQVAAYNIKGVGVYTRSIRIKTKEGVPAAPPKDVEALAVSSTSIKVSWKPPDPWMINGINQGYKIQAWKSEFGSIVIGNFLSEIMMVCDDICVLALWMFLYI